MNNIKERIKTFVKSQDLSVRQFERRASLSNGFVSATSNGINSEKIRQISKAFPMLNIDWLLNGNGEMLKPTNITQTNINGNNTIQETPTPEYNQIRVLLREKELQINHLKAQLEEAQKREQKLLDIILNSQQQRNQ